MLDSISESFSASLCVFLCKNKLALWAFFYRGAFRGLCVCTMS